MIPTFDSPITDCVPLPSKIWVVDFPYMTGQHPFGCKGLVCINSNETVERKVLLPRFSYQMMSEVLAFQSCYIATFRAPISGPKIHRSDDVVVDANDPASLLSISSTDSGSNDLCALPNLVVMDLCHVVQQRRISHPAGKQLQVVTAAVKQGKQRSVATQRQRHDWCDAVDRVVQGFHQEALYLNTKEYDCKN